jgi:hypothetical protein
VIFRDPHAANPLLPQPSQPAADPGRARRRHRRRAASATPLAHALGFRPLPGRPSSPPSSGMIAAYLALSTARQSLLPRRGSPHLPAPAAQTPGDSCGGAPHRFSTT